MTISPRHLIEKAVADFEGRNAFLIDQFLQKSTKLEQVCRSLERTWSGSYIGWHGRMYFRSFEIPSHHDKFSGEWGDIHGLPVGWEEKTNNEVRDRIDLLMGEQFSEEVFERDLTKFRTELDELRRDVDLYLSSLSVAASKKAGEYLGQLTENTIISSKDSHIRSHLPGTNLSRDLEALRQGTCIPAWLYFEGVAVEAVATVEWFEKFKRNLGRLFQAMEMAGQGSENRTSLLQFALHPEILSKCAVLYDAVAYPEAVEKSFKIVRDRLRMLTGHETGSEAFGKGKLYIVGAAAPNVDGDFNQGAKFLMMAIDMFRNEKSHTSDAKIDEPGRAYQYLVLSSLAMYLLDKAEIRP